MPLPSRLIDVLRLRALKAFQTRKGVYPITYYNATITKNIYHDETAVTRGTGITAYAFILFDAPTKVVKDLGWWKEGESLPLIMYMIWQSGVIPKKGDIVVIASTEGYKGGTYKVNDTKQFGQEKAICWALNLSSWRRLNDV